MGWKSEVRTEPYRMVEGEEVGDWYPNGVVWPDEDSALAAGADIQSRWLLVLEHRAVQVDEEPNRPTWDEWVAEKGLPPRSVQL